MSTETPAPEANRDRKAALLVVHEYPPIVGGAGVQVRDQVAEMRKHCPVVILTASPDNTSSVEEDGNVTVVRLGLPFRHPVYHYATAKSVLVFMVKALWAGWKLGRKHKFDVIHGFFVVPAGFVAVLLGKLIGVQSCVTAIAGEIYPAEDKKKLYGKWYYRKLIAWVMKHATKFSAISSEIAGIAKTYFDGRDIPLLPPGVVEYRPMPDLQPHDGFVLCSLSRLYPIKGVELVLEALAELKDLPIRYEIIGDGVSRNDLEKLAADLGIADRVIFHGFVTDAAKKFDIMTKSDVYVISSIHEGFPLTLLEAMNAGLPLIATDTGGHVDYFVDGKNGVLLHDREKSSMVNAIRTLFEALPDERKAMSELNKQTVQRYLMHNLVLEYLAHYDEPAN